MRPLLRVLRQALNSKSAPWQLEEGISCHGVRGGLSLRGRRGYGTTRRRSPLCGLSLLGRGQRRLEEPVADAPLRGDQ